MDKTAIIAYGSLLHPDELNKAYEDVSFVKIRLKGYTRHFAQKSTFRSGDNGERGVSTVTKSEGDWISALLITGLTESEYEEYTERESGYRITTVSSERISFYDESWDLSQFEEILLPVGTRPLKDPTPIPSYVKLCTEGAFENGDQFGTDFVLTTQLTS